MDHASWAHEGFQVPAGFHTMITPEEQAYLHWIGRTEWRGEGSVVEIGPWLGGSTMCLAAGMRASPHDAGGRLKVFDRFVWEAYMGDPTTHGYAVGDSFYEAFAENIAPFRDIVDPAVSILPDDPESCTRGDLPLIEFDAADPVEILFVDGAKSWFGLRYLLLLFRDVLIPGRSLLILQDFKWWSGYWVSAIAMSLAVHLEPVHNTLGGFTIAFRVNETLPAGPLHAIEERLGETDPDRVVADIVQAGAMLDADGDPFGAAAVRLGIVPFLLARGCADAAAEALRRAERTWRPQDPTFQLEQAQQILSGL